MPRGLHLEGSYYGVNNGTRWGPCLRCSEEHSAIFPLSTDAWLVLVGAAAQPPIKVPCHEIQRGFSFAIAFNGGCGGGVRSPLGNILCADGLS